MYSVNDGHSSHVDWHLRGSLNIRLHLVEVEVLVNLVLRLVKLNIVLQVLLCSGQLSQDGSNRSQFSRGQVDIGAWTMMILDLSLDSLLTLDLTYLPCGCPLRRSTWAPSEVRLPSFVVRG